MQTIGGPTNRRGSQRRRSHCHGDDARVCVFKQTVRNYIVRETENLPPSADCASRLSTILPAKRQKPQARKRPSTSGAFTGHANASTRSLKISRHGTRTISGLASGMVREIPGCFRRPTIGLVFGRSRTGPSVRAAPLINNPLCHLSCVFRNTRDGRIAHQDRCCLQHRIPHLNHERCRIILWSSAGLTTRKFMWAIYSSPLL